MSVTYLLLFLLLAGGQNLTLADALEASLKEKPNIGMIGEKLGKLYSDCALTDTIKAEATECLARLAAHKNQSVVVAGAYALAFQGASGRAMGVVADPQATAEMLIERVIKDSPRNEDLLLRMLAIRRFRLFSTRSPAERGAELKRHFATEESVFNELAPGVRRSYVGVDLAKDSLTLRDNVSAGKYARMLLLAPRDRTDWNDGNVQYYANMVLGEIALHENDRAMAVRYLLASGRTPGSPQLNSFGPGMVLAKDLLDFGETKAVLEFLRLCGTFWKMDQGKLARWSKSIDAGAIPDFGTHLRY